MIYVLLVALPALLEGILRKELAGHPGLAIEVLARPAGAAEVRERLARGTEPPGSATAVVARDDTPGLEDLQALLDERRCLQLLILSADGRSATLHRHASPPALLHDPSPTDLARALRSSVTHEF